MARICEINRIPIGSGLRLADSGNPDTLVESMLGPGLRSKMQGTSIHVWRCREIREYIFLDEPESTCSTEWPVQFKHGQLIKRGWISGSYEIHRDYTPVTCPQPEFFFTSNDYTYLLNSKEVFAKHEPLPNPGDPSMAKAFVEATFTGGGEYSATDMRGGSTWYEFLKDLQKSMRVTRMLESSDGLDEDSEEGSSIWKNIKHFVSEKVKAFFMLFQLEIGGGVLVIVFAYMFCRCRKNAKKCVVKVCRPRKKSSKKSCVKKNKGNKEKKCTKKVEESEDTNSDKESDKKNQCVEGQMDSVKSIVSDPSAPALYPILRFDEIPKYNFSR